VPTNLCFRIGAHATNLIQSCANDHRIALPTVSTTSSEVPFGVGLNSEGYAPGDLDGQKTGGLLIPVRQRFGPT